MSWQAYADQLVSTGSATAAGIYDLQGNPWAYSAGFAAREAERDVEEARAFGASGVVAGLLLGGLLNWYVVGYLGARPDGGVADGLERSLDLLQ